MKMTIKHRDIVVGVVCSQHNQRVHSPRPMYEEVQSPVFALTLRQQHHQRQPQTIFPEQKLVKRKVNTTSRFGTLNKTR